MILWTAKMEVENTENIFVYIIVDANLAILCQDISESNILGPNQTYHIIMNISYHQKDKRYNRYLFKKHLEKYLKMLV